MVREQERLGVTHSTETTMNMKIEQGKRPKICQTNKNYLDPFL